MPLDNLTQLKMPFISRILITGAVHPAVSQLRIWPPSLGGWHGPFLTDQQEARGASDLVVMNKKIFHEKTFTGNYRIFLCVSADQKMLCKRKPKENKKDVWINMYIYGDNDTTFIEDLLCQILMLFAVLLHRY